MTEMQHDNPFSHESTKAPKRPLVCAGLFAGIGGIELGLGQSGHSTRLLCELDAGAMAVLEERFPGVAKHSDVTTLRDIPVDTDLLTAGFPCQDLSQAGRTKGIAGARSGLVGEVFRLLETQPIPHVLIENVPFMLQLGRGEALDVVVSALECLGYRWAYRVVDSRAFGLPQRRRRVILLASLDEDPRCVLYADDAGAPEEPGKGQWRSAACGFYWTEGLRGLGWAHDAVPTLKGGSTVGIPSPPAIVFPSGEIGTPHIIDAERLQGFDANWTAPAAEVVRASMRWKLVGNAVSVDTAAWVGRRLRNPGVYRDQDDLPRGTARRSWPSSAYNVGTGRMVPASLSEFPVQLPRPALADFLTQPLKPLSVRAARGFHGRATKSTLKFPPGFLKMVQAHFEALAADAL